MKQKSIFVYLHVQTSFIIAINLKAQILSKLIMKLFELYATFVNNGEAKAKMTIDLRVREDSDL